MPRVSKKSVLAAQQDGAAPFLFDADQLPLKPEWIQAVREKRYEHTGARLLDDEAKCQRMVDLLCLGQGVKRVANSMRVSPHCVRAARTLLVEQGRLAPFKERFVKRAEEFVEDGLEKMHEAVISGKLHPNFMSSAVGTIFDKRSLALGEPTSINLGATAQLKPEALSVQALNDWVSSLPLEGESSGKPTVFKDLEALDADDAGVDATKSQPKDGDQGVNPEVDAAMQVPAVEAGGGMPTPTPAEVSTGDGATKL